MYRFQKVSKFAAAFGFAASLTVVATGLACADIVVAADGSGQYKTISEAIAAAPSGTSQNPTVIDVKPGTYHELLYVQREKHFIRLKGEDSNPSKTVITYGLYAGMLGLDGKPIGTFRTPTVYIDADDFTVENMTIVNSAGSVGQALALRDDGDRDVFKNCRVEGWQDTVLDNRGRHYYDDCTITGAVDFIFGGATAVYDHCSIEMLRDRGGVLTAPSTAQDQTYGLVFLDCHIVKGSGVMTGQTTLMRPWRQYGESAFINCIMDDLISPMGWSKWDGKETTCRAFEYKSVTPDGRPVDVTQRASWSHQLSKDEASKYTLSQIFGDWNPHMEE